MHMSYCVLYTYIFCYVFQFKACKAQMLSIACSHTSLFFLQEEMTSIGLCNIVFFIPNKCYFYYPIRFSILYQSSLQIVCPFMLFNLCDEVSWEMGKSYKDGPLSDICSVCIRRHKGTRGICRHGWLKLDWSILCDLFLPVQRKVLLLQIMSMQVKVQLKQQA